MEAGHHVISLDLGFAGEPTALAVIEPTTAYHYATIHEDALDGVNHFDVRHLERFPPGTPYSEVAARVKEISSDRSQIPHCTVLVNTSSSGEQPLKPFRERNVPLQAHTIVNGDASTWQGQAQGVAKRSIVGATVVALQKDRLRVARGLELGKALVDELVNFRMKPVTANDPVEAMREGANGDLVFAVALGCWWADRLGWNEEVAERMQARTGKLDWGWELGRNSTTGY